MKFLKTLILLVIVAGVAAGGYWYYQNRIAATSATASSGTYTQVVEVRKGTLSSTISVVGQLDAVESEDLSFQHMSGVAKVQSLAVKAGSSVTKGQVLATIDPGSYQQALDQAKSDLQAAEKNLTDLKTPATALEIAQADLAVAKARYQVQQAQSALDDLLHPDIAKLQSDLASAQSALAKAQSDLLSKQQDSTVKTQLDKLRTAEATPAATYNRLAAETYSDAYYQDRLRVALNAMLDAQDTRALYEIQQQADLLSAEITVKNARLTLAAAQKALADAQAGGDRLALAKGQLDVQDAQVSLEAAQQARADLDAGTDATTLAAAQADVDKKRLAVADAEAALAGTKLAASFDGTVLKLNANVGDQVSASTVVLTVANLKNLQVAANVDETTIKRVSAGQSAQITFDAFAGQTLPGKVLSVPLEGTLQGGVMVYEVPLSLEGADRLALLVGMTANVKIQTQQVKDALLLPTIALQRASGGTYQVLIPASEAGGQPTTVPVEVGLSDGTNTQITKGLNAGDQVVIQMTSTTSTSSASGNNRNNMPAGGVMIDMGGGVGGPPPGVAPGR